MLGKLIKTDLRSTARTFLPLCAGLLLLAIAMVICMTVVPGGANDAAGAAVSVAYLIYSLEFLVFSGLAFIIPVQRFRRCILKNDAYLMLTIPVKPWMHIVSKLICSVVWYIAAQVCQSIVSAIMLLSDKDFMLVTDLFVSTASDGHLDSDTIIYMVVSFLNTLMLIIFAQLFLYMVFVVSSLSNRHRGVISMAMVLLGIALLSWGYGMIFVISYRMSRESLSHFLSYSTLRSSLTCIYYAACSVVFYTVTTLILGRKYNLQ